MFIAYESIPESDDESRNKKKRKLKDEHVSDTDEEDREIRRKKARRGNK